VTKVAGLLERDLDVARWAIYAAFAFNGFSWGTFIPRIPDVKNAFALSNSQLGLTLLAGSIGVLVALKPGGYLCARYGSRRVLLFATVYMSLALMLFGVMANYAWFVGSLLFLGVAIALQDISMNTHAATIEQAAGRSLMNGFHAWFSVGALVGGGCGALFSQFAVSTLTQMLIVGAIGLATLPWFHQVLLPAAADRHEAKPEPEAERHRPTIFYILGLLGFLAAVCEGSAADWGAILLRDTWQSSPFVSSLPFILFSATMVIFRFSGDWITDRFDRHWVIRTGGFTSGIGLLVGVLIGGPLGICFGFAMLGVGISVAIPSVFSAASHIARTRFAGQISPAAATAIIGAVSYSGFLVGPPLLGFVADAITLRWAMLVPAVFAIVLGLSARTVKSN
jgi:MFS family permease